MRHASRTRSARQRRTVPDGGTRREIRAALIPRASRRTATVAEIARLTERLHGVLPTAFSFAEVCGDSEMTTKLTDLKRLVDRFDAACERRLRFSDLTVMLQRIEGGVRDVTRCLDAARVRGGL